MSYPNDQGNPLAAIPVYITEGAGGLTITDHSDTFPSGATSAVPENLLRRYLFIQCVTASRDIWINMIGGAASPNAAGSFLLAAGQTYESGLNVPGGAISIHAPSHGTVVTILEG